ncbi:unnamed protein product [Heterosigma akashiwo]|mmetsp:Transcript_18477/g.32320  ORF Transcript_18477/g.32320 Transcript_18477/m.32320 type:complete len:125 (-) Transcript_18477:30-404(-)
MLVARAKWSQVSKKNCATVQNCAHPIVQREVGSQNAFFEWCDEEEEINDLCCLAEEVNYCKLTTTPGLITNYLKNYMSHCNVICSGQESTVTPTCAITPPLPYDTHSTAFVHTVRLRQIFISFC